MDKHYSTRRRRSSSAGDETSLFDVKSNTTAHKVMVSPDEVRHAKVAVTQIPQIRSIVDRICSDSVESGMHVSLLYGDQVIELQSSEQRIVETAWPSFVRAALVDLLTLGYVIVGRSKSSGMPFVIPAERVNLVFTESVANPRQYWVEEGTGGTVEGMPMFGTSGKASRRIDALVFVKEPPDSRGGLTSPVHISARYNHKIEEAMNNLATADFVRAHLPFVYEPDIDRMKVPDPSERDQVLPGEVQQAYRDYNLNFIRQVQSNLHSMRSATAQLSTVAPAAVSSASVLGNPLVPEDVQKAPPGSNHICLPAGIKLVQPVVPQHNNSLFQAYVDMCTTQIMTAFKVPVAVLDVIPSSNRYTAPVQESHRRYYRTIESYQRLMAMLVSETFMWSNEVVLDQYGVAMMQKFTELQNDAMLAVNAYLAGRTKSGAAKRPKTDASPKKNRKRRATDIVDDTSDYAVDDSDYDGDADSDANAAAAASQKPKQPKEPKKPKENPLDELDTVQNVPVLDKLEAGSRVLKAGDTPETLDRAKIILGTDPKSIIEAAKQKFSVRVQFRSQPQYDLSELTTIMDLGIIGMDQVAKQAAAVLGINEKSMLLTQKQRLEEATQQMEVAQARMAPVPDATTKSPALAPPTLAPKKPAAVSSSSSASSAVGKDKLTKQPQK